jgi:hypothetical protein
MKRLVSPALILVTALAASVPKSSALACDRSPDLMRIPGSTDQEAEARYRSYEQARDIIATLELEKKAIESHWTVYLAKVEKVAPSATEGGPSTVSLKPVWQVRGLLPAKSATIEEKKLTSCDWPPGGLHGTKPGELVVVFENPWSTTGWPAGQVRSGELIDAINMYALTLEKKPR